MSEIEQTEKALIMVDVQNDFCPGGALAVAEGDLVVPKLNRLATLGRQRLWTLVATRDWHPRDTTHFATLGGIWPDHCVQGTEGGLFHPDLNLRKVEIYSKGMGTDEDAYSGFDARNPAGVHLEDLLKLRKVSELYVGGLATDYCVKGTVLDGLEKGFEVSLLTDAIRAVNLKPDDGEKAIAEMVARGARLVTVESVLEELDRTELAS